MVRPSNEVFGEPDMGTLYKKLEQDLKYKGIMYELKRGLRRYAEVDAFLRGYSKHQSFKEANNHMSNAMPAIDIINDTRKREDILDLRDLFEPPDLLAKGILELVLYVKHPVFASRFLNEKTARAALLLISNFSVDLNVCLGSDGVKFDLLRSSLNNHRKF